MAHYVTADEAVKLIKSYDKIYVQGSGSIPDVLLDALVRRAGELRGVELYSGFAISKGESPYCKKELLQSFYPVSLFIAPSVRGAINRGEGQCIPSFLGEVPALFRERLVPLDVTLLNVSPPDRHGFCSYGISADLAVSAVETSRVIIAQINRNIPYSYGDALIHLSQIDACVEVDEPVVEIPMSIPGENETKIGKYIAEQIPDGATLQIGVGAIPNAVLSALTDHKDLGLHTEALTDGVVPLLQSGVINNSKKKVMPYKTIAALAVGSKRLYDFMDYNKDIIFKDVAWTNDPFRIRQNPKVMAINSAIEIDLTGQICADSIGERMFSGVGGQHDFMYGGSLSEGGKTFIAITATSPKGHSKIKPVLTSGAGVVTTRAQAQYIVTEHGIAYLRGKDLAQRAHALIAIADPSVREELEKAACKRFGYSFLRVK